MRGVLLKFKPHPIYGALGSRKPEAYEILRDKGRPIYVLGPYDATPTSGLDVVSTAGLDCVIALVEKYRIKGHVLMEGILVSSNFGSIGEYLVKHKEELIIAILDTSLEDCLRDLAARQVAAGKEPHGARHLEGHYKRIHGTTQQKFIEYGIRVEAVSRENAVGRILSWLN